MLDPFVLVRGVHFAATLLVFGTISFLVFAVPPSADVDEVPAAYRKLRERLTKLICLALGVAVLSGAAWLVLLASKILDASPSDVFFHGGVRSVLTETRFGLVWSIRLALALSLAVMLSWPVTRSLQITVAAVFLRRLHWSVMQAQRQGWRGTSTSSRTCSICSPPAPGSVVSRRSSFASGPGRAALSGMGETPSSPHSRALFAARGPERRSFGGKRPR